MLSFASSWETKISTTGSRLGEVAVWRLIGRIVLTYVPLLFQSLDNLLVLAAEEEGPDDHQPFQLFEVWDPVPVPGGFD